MFNNFKNFSLTILLLINNLVESNDQCKVYDFITEFNTQDPFILQTRDLTKKLDIIDTNFLPYIGNGHLATTIYSDSIFVNGLYNGKNADSHRAHVPNFHNFEILNANSQSFSYKQYALDMKSGVFIEQLEDDKVSIQRRVFAHQFYNRLLINQILVKRKTNETAEIELELNFKQRLGDDLSLENSEQKDGYMFLKLRTKEVEFNEFQDELINIYMYYNQIQKLKLKQNQNELLETFITSIDFNQNVAETEFKMFFNSNYKTQLSMYDLHKNMFSKLWDDGRIESDNIELQIKFYSSYYYLLSSLPVKKSYSNLNKYYGLSSSSLGRGSLNKDKQGHTLWDTEMWMFPTILMFHPDLAREILSYRINTGKVADYNAKLLNQSGWRFPRESAFTGIDLTNNDEKKKTHQIHISGDIAFAARQYIFATQDLEWLSKSQGYRLIRSIAKYWASRMNYNKVKQQFEITDTMTTGDSSNQIVNNSIYTNVLASLSIFLEKYASCLINDSDKYLLTNNAENKARCIHIPFDKNKKVNLEYEGFNQNQFMSQSDVIFTNFPLMMIDLNNKIENINYYQNMINTENYSIIGLASLAISQLEIGNNKIADSLFEKIHTSFIKESFNIWTDQSVNPNIYNYLTGAASFIQVLMFGYTGLRLNSNQLTINANYSLPSDTTYLYLHNIKYLNSSLSFNFTDEYLSIKVNYIGKKLELKSKHKTYDLEVENEIKLPRLKFTYTIKETNPGNKCEMPYDKIDLVKCSPNHSNKFSNSISMASCLYLLVFLVYFRF